MAVTLNVVLTDAEQARLVAIANQVAPGMTQSEIKAWAEKHAKQGLREIVQRKLTNHNQLKLDVDWPIEPEPVPAQGAF